MHNNMLPFVLSFVSLLNIFFIWRGHRAILAGNWLRHRTYMVVSLFLWGLTLGGFAYFLWSTRLWALIGTQVLFIMYALLAVVASAMLVVTLWRVVKHQFLPHKIFARKTIVVWQLASFCGLVLNVMIGFSFSI